jgi:hypothetical protein
MTAGAGTGGGPESPAIIPMEAMRPPMDQKDIRGLAFEGSRRLPFDPSRGSKCFSCEAQDAAMGITRDYGSKCIDCENQDRSMGIVRGYGSKWY